MSKRESMSYDVVIVGAGVAGLAAAIRLKQLAAVKGDELSVVVLEKGELVGAHVLSGALIDPVGLDQLIPDWRDKGAPLTTKTAIERLVFLTRDNRFTVPPILVPPSMRHDHCYVGSLGAVSSWLGEQAEGLGVEIYPGFAGAELVFDKKGKVQGVVTPDQGLDRGGKRTHSYVPGMELRGRYTLIAEGARGFLAEQVIDKFDLRRGRDIPKYALGLKELWRLPKQLHEPGNVSHMIGWPLAGSLARGVRGGGFVYHYGDNLVSVGLVVHADYNNPALSPFELFQMFKTHPSIRPLLSRGKRIGYGARTIAEGGWQSLPKLTFPGGALLGCAAGMVNLASLQGSHNAILSGRHAAKACFEALCEASPGDELIGYQTKVEHSEIAGELKAVSDIKPLLERFGTSLGGAAGLMGLWAGRLVKRTPLFDLSHVSSDRASLRADRIRIAAPFKPDGIVSFERASSLALAGVYHEEMQKSHLVFKRPVHQLQNWHEFGLEPAQYYCPAGVFELRKSETEGWFIHISSSNCLHCKMCDIKDPADNIIWQVPPSGGPTYVDM